MRHGIHTRQRNERGVLVAEAPEVRFWRYVDKTETCWNWIGSVKSEKKPYGNFALPNKGHVVAHRFAYELLVGPIPKGLTIDHLCRNHRCVNPAHLEPVTMKENILRGECPPAQNARKTHCPKGHPFDEENTYIQSLGGRGCRICNRKYQREWARAKKANARSNSTRNASSRAGI